ncbi:hypothetical protein BYT27DRAFT_7117125 [Phlegmacium glaucopus]|nr:hypothetical protein BYT27DRAFT_7117125 [Phlegmacium glaucopus]
MCLDWIKSLCCCDTSRSSSPVPQDKPTPNAGSPQQTEQLELVVPIPAGPNTRIDSSQQLEKLLPFAEGLPSQVDETFGACPRFRILLAGKAGIGKSSLIRCIFNLDSDKVDVAHGRVGTADINREYTSLANPRFILHDSKGFEPGNNGTWTIVEQFLKERQKFDLPNKIHALW